MDVVSLAEMLPQTRVLLVGPAECVRHMAGESSEGAAGAACSAGTAGSEGGAGFEGAAGAGAASGRGAVEVVVGDVDAALGLTGERVIEAVCKLKDEDPGLGAVVVATGCTAAFLGLDGGGLCREIRGRAGVRAAYVEMNRMDAGNIPGPTRCNVPGGDRFHVRRALFGMLGDGELRGEGMRGGTAAGELRSGGVLVLGDDAIDAGSDLLLLLGLSGIEWVRSPADFRDFDDFLECGRAVLVLVMSTVWRETGQWLGELLGVPVMYAPVEYAGEGIEAAWGELLGALEEGGVGTRRECDAVRGELAGRRERALRAIGEAARDFGEVAGRRASGGEGAGGERSVLDVRWAQRPYALVEALIAYGFELGGADVAAAEMRLVHVEDDDAGARGRLLEGEPELVGRMERRARGRRERSGARRDRELGRHGAAGRPEDVESGEAALWGWSALEGLAGRIERQMAGVAAGETRGGGETPGAGERAAGELGAGEDARQGSGELAAGELDSANKTGFLVQGSGGEALVVYLDSHVPEGAPEGAVAVNLPDLAYAVGDLGAFRARIAELLACETERRESEGLPAPEGVELRHGPVSRLVGLDVGQLVGE